MAWCACLQQQNTGFWVLSQAARYGPARLVIYETSELALYQIEQGLFQADVESAQGALDKAKASLTLANLQRQRAEDLLSRASGTVVARDQAIAEELSAKGAVLTAEAIQHIFGVAVSIRPGASGRRHIEYLVDAEARREGPGSA